MSLLQLLEVIVVAVVVLKPEQLPRVLSQLRTVMQHAKKFSYQGLQAVLLEENIKKAEAADGVYQEKEAHAVIARPRRSEATQFHE